MKYLLLFSIFLTLNKWVSAQEDELLGCPSDIQLFDCSGVLPNVVYSEPYFSNITSATSVRVDRIEGPASGSQFPIGSTRVTYVARWACGGPVPNVFCTDTCSFYVTVTQKPGTIFYRDWDLDGWGNTNSPDNFIGCLDEAWPFFSQLPGDCNDGDPTLYRSIQLYFDYDGDGYTNCRQTFPPICYGDEWPPIWSLSNPETNPDIKVTSLGIDADDSDPNITIKYLFRDADGDGYTNGDSLQECSQRKDYTSNPQRMQATGFLIIDCNDEDSTMLGEKYFFRDADGDGYTTGDSLILCSQTDGYTSDPKRDGGLLEIDCNDSDPIEHPNQGWILDNDLDHYGQGVFSGGFIKSQCTRPSGNWFAASELISQNDCDDGNASITMNVWVLDADRDGYYTGDSVSQCAFPGDGYVKKITQLPGDCNDNDREISPFTFWYKDGDGDGYDDPTVISDRSCTAPGPGYSATSKGPDCNDTDSTLNPETIWYRDVDGDGYNVTGIITQPSCTPPGPGYSQTTKGLDCNDNDPALPATYWYKDADGDGYHNELVASITAPSCTPPTSEFRATTKGPDCNDNDSTINPATIWYKDSDGDGYTDGWYVASQASCTSPGGSEYVTKSKGNDCDDTNAGINPETVWYLDADDDGYYIGSGVTTCQVFLDGYKTGGLLGGEDCNDDNAAIHAPMKYYKDADNDGYGGTVWEMLCVTSAPTGYRTTSTDCNDNSNSINPATIWVKDSDLDGYYSSPVTQCVSPGAGYVIKTSQPMGDCNDNDPTVNPASAEVCGNNKDDNCNNVQNENGCYACGNATSFSTTNITGNSAVLNWTSIPNPNSWQVQYKTTKPGSKWVDVKPDLAGSKRSVLITGLTLNQKYQWHIKAKCNNTWTAYSNSFEFVTRIQSTSVLESTSEIIAPVIDPMEIKALPNPTRSGFTVIVNSGNLNDRIKLVVTDVLGRIVETRITYAGQAITFGYNYKNGTYLIVAIQGSERKHLKLLKLGY